jgi:hypothetical protein
VKLILPLSIAIVFAALGSVEASAEGPACTQARAIVEEVWQMYAGAQVDHRAALFKLQTARNLCRSLGEAWKLSFCSATALGDTNRARLYKDQAVLNGVDDLDCGAAVPSAAIPAPLSRVREKFALIVGVGDFKDAAIPKLRFPAKDAKDLAEALRDPGVGRFKPENVLVLTNTEATRKNINARLQQLILRAQEDDLVLLFVSSHGSPRQEGSGLGGVGYIVTYDAGLANMWDDALAYEDFRDKVALIRARRKVTFLDTCFSGEMVPKGAKALVAEGPGVDEATAKMFLSGEGSFVITSSRATEKSYESARLQNGYFTYYLVKALRELPEPTVKNLYARLSQQVADAVASGEGQPQHPEIHPKISKDDVNLAVIPSPAP